MKFYFIFHRSALHIAVEKRRISITRILLNYSGTDVNAKDEIYNHFFFFYNIFILISWFYE